MDIRDVTKHPFRIECPADLIGEDPGDQWLFTFDNGHSVWLAEDQSYPGHWNVTAVDTVRNEAYQVELHMTDSNGDITNLLDRIARLERKDV
jgi:hypothetical protein